MDKILLVIIYILDFIRFRYGWKHLFGYNKKIAWFDILGVIIYISSLIFIDLELHEYRLSMNIFIFLGFLLQNIESIGKRFVQILKLYFVILLLDGFCDLFMDIVIPWNAMLYGDNFAYISSSFSTYLIILLYVNIQTRKKYNFDNILKKIQKYVPVLLFLIFTSLLFAVVGLDFVGKKINNTYISKLLFAMGIIVFISVGFIALFFVYYQKTNMKLTYAIELEKNLQRAKLKNQELILERDQETRKYRHDMINHLIYLQVLAGQNKIESLQLYLQQMLGQIKKIQQSYYSVGNFGLDAILNNHLCACGKDVKISVKGFFPFEMDIAEMDLCIIFSNLLQNAVEYLAKTNIEDKFLEIEIKYSLEYLYIQIKNRAFEEKISGKIWLQTNKIDKENHGFGLANVKETVNRNQGYFQYELENRIFSTRVTLRYRDRLRS